jgi:hypothetical protein
MTYTDLVKAAYQLSSNWPIPQQTAFSQQAPLGANWYKDIQRPGGTQLPNMHGNTQLNSGISRGPLNTVNTRSLV